MLPPLFELISFLEFPSMLKITMLKGKGLSKIYRKTLDFGNNSLIQEP